MWRVCDIRKIRLLAWSDYPACQVMVRSPDRAALMSLPLASVPYWTELKCTSGRKYGSCMSSQFWQKFDKFDKMLIPDLVGTRTGWNDTMGLTKLPSFLLTEFGNYVLVFRSLFYANCWCYFYIYCIDTKVISFLSPRSSVKGETAKMLNDNH